jgi:hypothetical protein
VYLGSHFHGRKTQLRPDYLRSAAVALTLLTVSACGSAGPAVRGEAEPSSAIGADPPPTDGKAQAQQTPVAREWDPSSHASLAMHNPPVLLDLATATELTLFATCDCLEAATLEVEWRSLGKVIETVEVGMTVEGGLAASGSIRPPSSVDTASYRIHVKWTDGTSLRLPSDSSAYWLAVSDAPTRLVLTDDVSSVALSNTVALAPSATTAARITDGPPAEGAPDQSIGFCTLDSGAMAADLAASQLTVAIDGATREVRLPRATQTALDFVTNAEATTGYAIYADHVEEYRIDKDVAEIVATRELLTPLVPGSAYVSGGALLARTSTTTLEEILPGSSKTPFAGWAAVSALEWPPRVVVFKDDAPARSYALDDPVLGLVAEGRTVQGGSARVLATGETEVLLSVNDKGSVIWFYLVFSQSGEVHVLGELGTIWAPAIGGVIRYCGPEVAVANVDQNGSLLVSQIVEVAK